MNGGTTILALVFACGLLTGFGIYAVLSSDPGKTALYTENAPEPIGPYSQAVLSGDYLYLSGQIGLDPATGNLSDTVAGEARQAMENLRAVLREADLDFPDVVQTRIYVTDLADFDTVNAVYAEYLNEPYPARATVQVAGLPKGARVEIEMVAKVR
ncbi:RidA family protein [Methanoculleus horonobensis]|jgi:2-iminobutanoate/2-iminopropanoate deaminase|uniref:RidA family protein n=1 Tax=Methanoculleus horonobensis TaxID=528314 RepID=UPI000A022A2B|nr:RidA family protein [Methanoculleus horonobensis]